MARSLLLALLFTALATAGLAARVPPAAGSLFVHTNNIESALKDFNDGDDKGIKNHWALLIAGSMGWGNYRHQADICHAYQVLKRGGLDDDHIVVMMFDDIANHPENDVYPGQIFNKPGGPDVYKGVPKDYVRFNVNAATVLSVLAGDEEAVKGKGSGKVIKSGPDDRVFVVYSDHGAPGLLGMPAGPFLYADQLLNAITAKAAAGGFKEMVLYVEACESGSIFEGLLQDSLHVYATTASNAYESSWGTYCPGMDPAPPPSITTCLGDLYSVAWMENADQADLAAETLHRQYKLVRFRTANNDSYFQGSHVMRYGDLGIGHELAGDYMGMDNSGPTRLSPDALEDQPHVPHSAVPQRDAELLSLRARAARATDPVKKANLEAEIDAELARRKRADAATVTSAVVLLQEPKVLAAVAAHMGRPVEQLQAVLSGAVASGQAAHVGAGVEGGLEDETAAQESSMGVFSWWAREWKARKARRAAAEGGGGYWKWSWAWNTLRRKATGRGREEGVVAQGVRRRLLADSGEEQEKDEKDEDDEDDEEDDGEKHGHKHHKHDEEEEEEEEKHGHKKGKHHKHHKHHKHDEEEHDDKHDDEEHDRKHDDEEHDHKHDDEEHDHKKGHHHHKHGHKGKHEAEEEREVQERAAWDVAAGAPRGGPLQELLVLDLVVRAMVRAPVPPAEVHARNGGPRGVPLVRDWECLRGMVAAWERACRPMDGYSVQHSRYLANLCNLGVAPAQLEGALASAKCD